MSGHGYSNLHAALFLNLLCDLVGNRRIFVVFQFFLIFFFRQLGVLFGDRALCNCQNCKSAAAVMPFVDFFHNLVDIVRNFRDQNDVRAARDTGI